MRARYDGGSDQVAMLDAFKITRQGITREHDDRARWKIAPLTPWARDLLRVESTLIALNENDGTPISQSPDGFVTPSRGDLDRGVGFRRRQDAHAFLSDVEELAATWRRSPLPSDRPGSVVTVSRAQLASLLDYAVVGEQADYEENGCPDGHVYETIQHLRASLETEMAT